MLLMKHRLKQKLAALRADLDCGQFILADAKDADMAWGVTSPGEPYASSDSPASSPERGGLGRGDEAGASARFSLRYRSIADFRDQIREIVRQGAVDILLASASTISVLAHRERLFEGSDVTPAIRAN